MKTEINEKDFFSFLKENFPKNDFIELDSLYVPNNLSNKLNRFYDDSIWFSRLKISEDNSFYYFGLNEGYEQNTFSPLLIIKFNNILSKSTIRFSKNNILFLISVDKNSDNFNVLKNNFKMIYATKNKDSNLYYIDMGQFKTNEFINNIKFLLNTFNFNLDISKINLLISNFKSNLIDFNQIIYENDILNTIKFNLKVIELKNIIYNLNCDKNISKGIDEYLFAADESGDYYFNFETRKSDKLIFNSLNNFLPNLNIDNDYKSIINEIKIELDK